MTEQSRSTASTLGRPGRARKRVRRRPGRVIGAEQQPGQRVGIDMALEPHRGSALDVQHDAVPVVAGRRNRLVAGHSGPGRGRAPVEPVQPGQVVPEVTGVKPAAGDAAARPLPRGTATACAGTPGTPLRPRRRPRSPAASFPRSRLVKSNVVQRNPDVTTLVLSKGSACAIVAARAGAGSPQLVQAG